MYPLPLRGRSATANGNDIRYKGIFASRYHPGLQPSRALSIHRRMGAFTYEQTSSISKPVLFNDASSVATLYFLKLLHGASILATVRMSSPSSDKILPISLRASIGEWNIVRE